MAIMSRIALAALGMLAYQNRDKISAYLEAADRRARGEDTSDVEEGNDDPFTQILVTLGMSDLIRRLKDAGHDMDGAASSLTQAKVKSAIGAQTMSELASATGLSQAEVARLIASELPSAMADDADEDETDDALNDVPISRQ